MCYLAYCRDPVDAIQTASNEAYDTVEGGQGEGDAVYEMLPDPPSVPPSTSHPSQTTAGDSLCIDNLTSGYLCSMNAHARSCANHEKYVEQVQKSFN